VDGHTVVAPNYVSMCVETYLRTGADNVGGRMDAVSSGTFGRAVALATSSPFGVGGARFHYSDREEWVDTVYMGAWPRDVFNRIGFFDEEQVRNQDDEFNYRLLEHGGKVLLNPKIKSEYYNRSSLRSLWRQYYQYGYWKVRVMQKHPRQMRLRQFVPPAFVGALLLALALSPLGAPLRWAALAIAGAYLLANLSASLLSARRARWSGWWLLPVTFGALHFSYGAGFLWGLVRFCNRWDDRRNRVGGTGRTSEGLDKA
jgi:GT2 family glycosyltransferase